MPSWNIHLEAGERLADRMKLTGKNRKKFLFGCLLPDINNGYINQVGVTKEHAETHYRFDKKSSLNFYAENRKQVDELEPLYLGYLFHLYVDGYFNYDFYRTIKRHPLGEGLEHDAKREIKHHDFWLYDTNFHHELNLSPEERKEFAEEASKIAVAEITAEDIEDIERVLADETLNDAVKNDEFLFYSNDRLNRLMDEMIESFTKDYLKGKNA